MKTRFSRTSWVVLLSSTLALLPLAVSSETNDEASDIIKMTNTACSGGTKETLKMALNKGFITTTEEPGFPYILNLSGPPETLVAMQKIGLLLFRTDPGNTKLRGIFTFYDGPEDTEMKAGTWAHNPDSYAFEDLKRQIEINDLPLPYAPPSPEKFIDIQIALCKDLQEAETDCGRAERILAQYYELTETLMGTGRERSLGTIEAAYIKLQGFDAEESLRSIPEEKCLLDGLNKVDPDPEHAEINKTLSVKILRENLSKLYTSVMPDDSEESQGTSTTVEELDPCEIARKVDIEYLLTENFSLGDAGKMAKTGFLACSRKNQ